MELRPVKPAFRESLAGYAEIEALRQPYIRGFLKLRGRSIPVVSTKLLFKDVVSGWKVRWDLGRSHYTVLPGLYAVGQPGPGSPVLVGANYKLSFDSLRRELGGVDAWLLVLDTKGINVWCAAGKGTFGTSELLDKITRLRLDEIVSHNVLILPQLGAVGVSAPAVKKLSRFRVVYGPVRSRDIPAFLAAGMKKDEAMREVSFCLGERMTIAPVELSHAWPLLAAALGAAFLWALPLGSLFGPSFLKTAIPLFGAVLAGTLAFPALLPVLPSRAFSIKGAVLGGAWGAASSLAVGAGLALSGALVLVSAPLVAFLGLNFTGSSTYTSQTGAKLEVEKSLVPMILCFAAGIILAVAVRLFGF